VIRDLKIIQGVKGPFVAMPSRKLTDRCPRCHTKNHLRALHCNQCGAKLDEERATKDNDGRAKLYADIAHPINCDCRELIQRKVLDAYEIELVRAKEPGYICTYDDYGEEHYATLREPFDDEVPASRIVRTDDASHRLEPAAPQTVPPNHGVPSSARFNGAAAYPNVRHSEDDAFGAGLV
jgi:stage V sporulation protein G